MHRIPTVKVRFGEGFKIINESDYDPAVDVLFEEGAIESPSPSPDVASSTTTPKTKRAQSRDK